MRKYLLTQLLFISFLNIAFGQTPDWQWAKNFPGNSDDQFLDIDLDSENNVYVTGYFGSDSIIFGNDTLINDTHNTADILVAKLNQYGNVMWAKSAGGTLTDYGNDLTIDQNGNLYVTGYFVSDTISFDSSHFLINDSLGLGYQHSNIYIAKYNSSGDILWIKSEGDTMDDIASRITTDENGNLYLIGTFYSPTITFGGSILINDDSTGLKSDAFVVKYDSLGNVIWAKKIGGKNHENVSAVFTDPSGDYIYVAGSFFSDTLTFEGSGIYLLNTDTSQQTGDIFVAKFNYLGNLIWAKQANGIKTEEIRDAVRDDFENFYLTGSFYSPSLKIGNDSTVNADVSGLNRDLFLLKFDSTGNLLWMKSNGGIKNDLSYGLALDLVGAPYITGAFLNLNFNFGSSTLTNSDSSASTPEVFVAKYDSSGNELWAINGSGNKGDVGLRISADAQNNLFIAGCFKSTTLTLGVNDLDNSDTSNLTNDGFITRIGKCSANFFLYPDTTQAHHYYVVNQATGIPPIQYDWSWGDGAHDYTAYPSHVYADSGYYDICLTVTDSVGCSSTYCDSSFYLARFTESASMVYVNVVDQIVTYVSTEIQTKNGISISPNPAINKVEINAAHSQIQSLEIFNLIGEKIYSDFSLTTKVDLSVEDWNKGVYIVKVQTENGSSVQKLVIQ